MSFNLRRRLAGAVSVALLALTLTGPAAVNAATPDLIDTWSVIPTTVNNGDYVALRGSIYNNDTSTVSQLYLVELSRPAGFTPDSIKINLGGKGAVCDTTGDAFSGAYKCTLGQLKPGRTATVTVVFQTPATGTTATPVWEFNTTGIGSASGGDQSHGDSWPSGTALTVALSDSVDFGGRYVLNDGLKVVENSQALSNANPHSTRAYSPVTGIGVTVEDIDCTIEPVDPLCDSLAGFSQISQVNVNDDVDDSGITPTTLLHFYLQFDSSELPQGVGAGNISIEHVYPGGSETIDVGCTFVKKSTIPNNAPCIDAKNLPGGDLGVDVWTFHNGALRGNF